jgi:hypothetical protein
MVKATYRDLAEFGLPLIGPESVGFAALVRDMEDRPQPFAAFPITDLDTAAVLLNQSGKAIIALAYVWRCTTADGKIIPSRCATLGSSAQMDFLSGQGGVTQDLGNFILPGSKRLITERGMFGNNLDVLPPETLSCGGGWISGGGGGPRRNRIKTEITEIELVLDFVLLEDGLCAGPDEWGLFDSLRGGVERQLETARDVVAALRNGASRGHVFELLLPLARSRRGIGDPGRGSSPLLSMFADIAIHRLVDFDDAELLHWFEQSAQSTPVPLHRP